SKTSFTDGGAALAPATNATPRRASAMDKTSRTGGMVSRGADCRDTTFVVSSDPVRRLSESDYQGVLDVLREAAAVEGPIPFTRPVLEALRRLVPCDVVT